MQELTTNQRFLALVAANPHKDNDHCALDRVADGLGITLPPGPRRWTEAARRFGFSDLKKNAVMDGWDHCQDPVAMNTLEEYRDGYELGQACWRAAHP